MIIDPFIFYPNYIPEFSDLIESTNQPHIIDIFTAYYDSYWERAFILEDGYSYYPGDIAEILIRLTNDKGQDIILDNGKLKLTPNIYDENMTISVFYTDTSIPPLTVTRNYDIFVSENHKPYINPIPETQRIAISNEEFALDFVNFGEDLDNDVIEYEMGATPYLNMQLSGTRFAWTPTSEYIGQIISVNFKL